MLSTGQTTEGAEEVAKLKRTRNSAVHGNQLFSNNNNNKKNLARIARYYRSSSLHNDDESEETSPDISSDLMPAESRLLTRPGSYELGNFERKGEIGNDSNDENEMLKKKEKQNGQISHTNEASQISPAGVSQAYSLPINYEYPELVQSLKNVYKEMFITGGLYLLNIVSAVGIVLVNKYIYSHYKFPHGLVLTLYHFILTSIGLQILSSMKFFPIKPVKLIKVLPLSVSFCLYVVLTNLSLQYNSGTFYQVQRHTMFKTLLILNLNHLLICRFWLLLRLPCCNFYFLELKLNFHSSRRWELCLPVWPLQL